MFTVEKMTMLPENALSQAIQEDAMLRLLQVPNLGAKSIVTILEQVPLDELLSFDKARFRTIGWTEKQIQGWFEPKPCVEQAKDWRTQPNCHLISLFDERYPYLLRQTVNPPPMLFIKGDPSLLATPQIAIVGSRACSDYGAYWAGYFALELNRVGFTVTSGLALGIDGYAHKAVVGIQGQTIAVLGSGLEDVYPRKHRLLADRILANKGALVSEFFPNQPPVAKHFPQRNRIISGLSQGTLIIEANVKSGSLITANYALEQNREVFALPGNIQNAYSQGCHKLIKQGATLVENVEDILEQLPVINQMMLPLGRSNQKTLNTPLASVQKPQKEKPLHPNLYQIIGYQWISLDDIGKQTGLTVDTLLVQLLDLEMQGLIRQESGGYVRMD